MTRDVEVIDSATKGEETAQGSVPPGHVPLKRFNEINGQVSELKAQLARAQGQVEGMTAAKPAEQPKQTYTRAQLTAAVDGGQMTQDDADSLHEQQVIERTTQQVTERVMGTVKASESENRALADIDKYVAARPDIMIEGTTARNRLADEFSYLTSMGHSDSKQTQALALRTVYGPVENLRPGTRTTHEETGRGDGGEEHTTGDGPPKDMSAGQRNYYQDQINKGQFEDWSAVTKLVAYKPKHSKRVRAA